MKRILKKGIVIFICLALLISKNIVVQAQQVALPVFVTSAPKTMALGKQTNELLNKKFKAYEVASFPVEELGKFLKANYNIESEFQLKLTDKVYKIKLQSSKIIAANYKLTIQEPTGMRSIQQAPDNIFYKGFANNDKTNTVRLTLKEGLVSGYIQQDGKEVFIESVTNYISTAAPNDVVIYNTTDALTTENNTCGVTERTGMIERATAQQKQEANRKTLTGVCKKLKFVFITDYGMYQFFNGDVVAMQNKLLATLNNAQGIYTNLNFGIDNTVDIGDDELNFEMKQFHVSTCKECDIIKDSISVLAQTTINSIENWVIKNTDTTQILITNYITRQPLYFNTNLSLAGYAFYNLTACAYKTAVILTRFKQDDLFDRFVTVHETGHVLGCNHDNNVKPSVTNYMMYYSVNLNATALSSFVDFQGVLYLGKPYSSKYMVENTVRALSNCLPDCGNVPFCNDITNLKVSLYNQGDSALLTWQGTSSLFEVKLNSQIANTTPYNVNVTTSANQYTLKGLPKCIGYTASIKNDCGNKNTIGFFNYTCNNIFIKIVNERTSLYDIELNNNENFNLFNASLRVTIDNATQLFSNVNNLQKKVFKNFFADGARHRVDFYNGEAQIPFKTIFYKAPYYRKDATVFLNEDFSGCTKPINWKDSIWRKPANTLITYTPYWNYDSTTKNKVRTIQAGSIDSTCMLHFYNSSVPGRGTSLGSIDMTTPALNVNNYENIFLSFDYKYILRAYSVRQPYFKVQCYDGQNWKTIYNAPTTIDNRTADSTRFWDTIPARKFIPLDAFANANLKVRFLVEDSSFIAPGQFRINTIFVALDNVRIDGYLKKGMRQNQEIKIFPNPVNDELFIRYDAQLQQPKRYRIIDVQGKLVAAATLNNYRINVANLAAAIYFIQFYFDDNTTPNTYKFYKY